MWKAAVMVAVGAVLVVASAGAAGADRGGVDVLAGSWQRPSLSGGFDLHTHVDAQSAPSGEDARGHFWSSAQRGEISTLFRGRVTCLNVVGNKAVAGGVVEESNDPIAFAGSFALFQVTDNGSPGAEGDTAINFLQATPEEARACPFFVFDEIPILQGNILVKDATP